MADRSTYSHLSGPPPTGLQFLEQYSDRLGQLFNASVLPLTAVGGTGNAVTATLDPPLLAGLVAGMKFCLTWGATNSGGMTLALNGGSPIAVLDASGAAMVSGAAAAGTRVLLEYVAGAFRVLGGAGGGLMMPRYMWQFTASGTWTKPTGLDDDTMVFVELWAGGGGGSSGNPGGGGGGGGYICGWFRLGDLASSVSVGIGAGGATNTAGGNTTFGALLTAYGGGRSNSAHGGGGGGAAGAGNTSGGSGGPGGRLGGGAGGTATGVGADAGNLWGGGGGGGSTGSSADGGAAIHGGGGGGSGAAGLGGASLLGGNGGAVTVAGVAPGGGGGRGAAGARGEVRIWI